jgi:hypothetical protein
MTEPVPLDVARCEALALRASAGDAAACKQLIEQLWPTWVRLVHASRSLRALGASEDHVHDIVSRLVEKIGQIEGKGLRLYPHWRERHPDKTFLDWIRIVTANAVRDYVRERSSERVSGDEPSAKRFLNEFAGSPLVDTLGVRPPMTAAQTARQLLEFARAQLAPVPYRALTLWIEGASFEDIHRELSLGDAEDARKLVRSGVAVLRRHFAPSDP